WPRWSPRRRRRRVTGWQRRRRPPTARPRRRRRAGSGSATPTASPGGARRSRPRAGSATPARSPRFSRCWPGAPRGACGCWPRRGVRLLSGAGCEPARQEQYRGIDQLLGTSARYGVGYGIFDRAVGWGGWGGSLVMVNLDARMTVAYVMNQMLDFNDDARGLG